MNHFKKFIRKIAILPIVIYQKVISPALPQSCIYTPTCSTYFKNAILKHGIIKGFLLGTSRIMRCAGGLYHGGEDQVPELFSFSYIKNSYKKHWIKKRKKKNNEK